MPRRRVAVALLPPAPLARAVQALRRAVDDPRRDDLPPHLTLVPPINLGDDAHAEARSLLRAVASISSPFDLELGPAASFAPATPTLHLELHGATEQLDELRALVRTGPLGRDDVWPFHPHVTLREELLDPEPGAAAQVLPGSLGRWTVDRLHLLEQRRDDSGRPHWVPVAEEPFGPAVVVGRGGIELELRCTTMVADAASVLFGGDAPAPDPFASGLVVTADEPGSGRVGAPVGVAVGCLAEVGGDGRTGVARLDGVVVDESSRRLGIGRHLLRRWCHEAAASGARVAVTPDDAEPMAELLAAEGFVRVGTTHVRQLPSE